MAKPILEGKNIEIGKNCTFGHNVVIHDGVKLGDNVKLMNNIVIYPEVSIGENTLIFDGAVLGRPPKSSGVISRKIKSVLGPLVIGEKCVIGANVVLYSGTKIGNNVLLGDSCSIREECEVGDFVLISRCTTINYNTKIGKRTKIMDNCHITGNMIIEEDVFISVLVSTTNDNMIERKEYDDTRVIGPTIKRGVLIGAGAILLPNIIIGENSVVAAGAVVTKDVPAKKIVMGIPARVVKDVPEEFLKGR